MPLSTLLLIPGDTDLANEIIAALRYEKTARLFVTTTNDEQSVPHRTVRFGPLPSIENPDFAEALADQLKLSDIDYILPTSELARDFFRNNIHFPPALDTRWSGELPNNRANSAFILDCYSNTNHGLIYISQRQQSPGGTWRTSEPTTSHIQQAKQLSLSHGLQGPWQLILSEKKDTPRITTGLAIEQAIHRPRGFNPALLLLHEARGNLVSVIPFGVNASMVIEDQPRLCLELPYETVFLDLDDTLIVHGAINDSVMSFIYHCKAHEIPVHLITRHHREPTITLCEFGIAEMLFESIIWITDSTPKSHYMQEAISPIFIDDAFSERSEVSNNTSIPCLTPDSVQALMAKL